MSPMALRQAQLLAASLAGEIAPGCERIEVAGSIRRQRAEVKDIELVILPKWGSEPVAGQAGLFGENTQPVNLAQRAIEALGAVVVQPIKPGTHDVVPWHLTRDGKYWRLYLPGAGLKVDVFVCTPETWGLNLMIRTGSGVGPSGTPSDGFAPAMLTRWKAITDGGWSAESRLHQANGTVRPTPEEVDVFEACRVRWLPPERRNSARDVEQAALT